MKAKLFWVVLFLFTALTAWAWQPSGWHWSTKNGVGELYSYSHNQGSWYFFDTAGDAWALDFASPVWRRIANSALASGWSYWEWPYAYCLATASWHYIDVTDPQWVLHLGSGQWSQLGASAVPSAAEDLQFLVDYCIDAQLLKIAYIEALSQGFTTALVPPEMVQPVHLDAFFEIMSAIQANSDEMAAVLERMGYVDDSSGTLGAIEQSPADSEVLSAGGLGKFVAVFNFMRWGHRSRVNARERILKVVSNMSAAERDQLYQDVKSQTRLGISGQVGEGTATEFWQAVESGKYDNAANVLHNDLYHSTDPDGFTGRYHDLASDPALKLRPIDVFVEEGAKGVEAGGKVVVAVVKDLAPDLGKGMDYAEKAEKYANYANDVYNGDIGKATKDYINDQLKDAIDDLTVSGVADGLDLLSQVIHDKDPTLAPPPEGGVAVVVDDNAEGGTSAVAIATADNGDEKPVVVISQNKKQNPENPEDPGKLIVPLPSGGDWVIDADDGDGNSDSVSVQVNNGTAVVVQVDTSPLPEFHVSAVLVSKTADQVDYRVTASISNLVSATNLSLSVSQAMFSGASVRHLASSGSVSWQVTVLQQNGSATVTRSDTGESRTVSLAGAGAALEYGLSIWASPANPGLGQGVTVHARITPAAEGVQLSFRARGTDGYSSDRTGHTDSGGLATFYVPGSYTQGVTDTITVGVVGTGVTRNFSYSFR